MHTNSKLIFDKYARDYFKGGLKVLEIGPDRFPSTYRSMITDETLVWETIDLYEHDDIDYRSLDEYNFPIENDTFDIVVSGQVMEHIRKPWVWIKEATRVCKPGGYVITVMPASWPYHEAPIDCWRAFPDGMRALYEDANLEVILAEWGNYELPDNRRKLPGRSPEWQSKPLRIANSVLGLIGFPVECSFDTIAIGQKTA